MKDEKNMDYKKKYNESLERAKKVIKECGDNHGRIKMIEQIFPELKDSEDERIRKELIQYLKDYPHLPNGKYCRNDFFSWLEKQGRQKTTAGKSYIEIFPKFSVGDTLCRQGWSNHTVRKVYVDNITATYVCENEEGLESHIDISEQDEWNKIEQNPAWNEEDDAVDIAIKIIQNGGDDCAGILDSDKALKWLKSLKYRVQPQPKQEWSEEDEKMLEDTISCLSAYQSPDISKGLCYQEQIDWLKSLKPNNWKPSEEQMKGM